MPNLTTIKKLDVLTAPAKLELSVSKKGGPVNTRAEVGSSGPDDGKFTDKQLTPGPAVMPLDPKNTYAILWRGAFVKAGTATLHVVVRDPQGGVVQDKRFTVKGKAKDEFVRVVLLP